MGRRSVNDIYRQSTHTENNRKTGVHCNKNDKGQRSTCRGRGQIVAASRPAC